MIREGSEVQWSWGKGCAQGVVEKIFKDDVTIMIDKNEVKRQASKEEPAYLINQSDGQRVLKSSSEVSRV